jgi:hypothetical protein
MTRTEWKRIDREAMRRAIQQMLDAGGEDEARFRQMLASEPWERVGQFAAYARQCRTLRAAPLGCAAVLHRRGRGR